jgi:hypothetical protein
MQPMDGKAKQSLSWLSCTLCNARSVRHGDLHLLLGSDRSIENVFESLQGRILWTILIGSFTSFSISGRLLERFPREQQVSFASRSCSTTSITAHYLKHRKTGIITYGSKGFMLFFISGGPTYRATTTAHSLFLFSSPQWLSGCGPTLTQVHPHRITTFHSKVVSPPQWGT